MSTVLIKYTALLGINDPNTSRRIILLAELLVGSFYWLNASIVPTHDFKCAVFIESSIQK